MIDLEKKWRSSFLYVTIVFYTSVTVAMWWRSGMLSSFVGVVIELWTCFATVVVAAVVLHISGALHFNEGVAKTGSPAVAVTPVADEEAKVNLPKVVPIAVHPRIASVEPPSAPEMEKKGE